MIDPDNPIVGSNINEPILQVNHFELNPLDERPNRWASECPKCSGVLTVARDKDTFELLPFDRCVLCGQRVEYLDIEDMRRKDGSR